MQNQSRACLALICCVAAATTVSAYTDAPAFEAYKPRVLVTPDNLPLLSWKDPGVDRQINPSDLNTLDLCTPGACSDAALEAGAAYYQTTRTLTAYYDEHGRLVGTAAGSSFGDSSDAYGAQAVTEIDPDDPRFTDAGVPAGAPLLVGATPGAFQVLPSGASTYRIPIDIPPGTAGTQPQLAISYNSQGGNGLLGIGWSLEGMSAITRCPQTFAQDDNFAGITYTGTDRFCLDGKRLVNVRGAYGADDSEYRTEIDSFSRIIAHGAVGGGPAWFEVKTKSGETLQYGFVNDTDGGDLKDNDARIEAQGKDVVAVWALNRVTDTAGNYFTLEYWHNTTNGEVRPTRIAYTGSNNPELAPYAFVNFVYETRPDPSMSFRADSATAMNWRLQSIVTRTDGKLVRKVDLWYEATTPEKPLSRLAHVQTCGNTAATATAAPDYKCLPATALTWHDYPAGFTPVIHSEPSADRVHESTHTMDVNGDGLDDLVYQNGGTWRILFANGDGFDPEQSTPHNTGDAKVTVFDWDSDGRDDLAVLPVRCAANIGVTCEPTQVDVLKSTGAGFTRTPTNITYASSRYFSGIRAGDIDGNGRTDLIIGDEYANKLIVYYNTNGVNFTPKTDIGLSHGWVDSRVFDYNGDGRADLLRWHETENIWYVVRSGGANFALLPTGITQHALQLADVNGDGLQDAVVDSQGKWAIRLNRGGSFGGLQPTGIDAGNDSEHLTRAQVVDFNSDGRDDFLSPFDNAWQLLRAKPAGTGLEVQAPTLIPAQGYDNGPQVGDFNGDGIMDLMLDYSATWHLFLHRTSHSGLITAINAGGDQFSDRITIDHRPLTRATPETLVQIARSSPMQRAPFDDFYTLTERIPGGNVAASLRGLMAPIYVVENYGRNNGVGGLRQYSYKYEDARLDLSGRGYLGFAKVTVRDLRDFDDHADDLYTVSAYTRSLFPYTGLLTRTEVHRAVIDETPLSQVTNVYDRMSTFGSAVNPYLVSSSERRYNINGDLLVTTNTNNSSPTVYGNIREITVDVLDHTQTGQNHTTTTVNTYGGDDPAAWRLGRLTRSIVTQTSGGGSSTRVASFEYAPATGLLTKEIVQPDTALALIKTYGRDDFGNIDTETVSGGDITTRTTATLYAPRGRFPDKITNALNHTEFHDYNPDHGGITSLKGPNGLETQWNYDVLGRKATNAATDAAAETRADGTSTNITYAWCGDCPLLRAVYKIITANSGAPQVIEYFDALGRNVLTETRAFDDGQWSKVMTQYDALGRVLRVSRPYGGSPSLWTDYVYDELGRVTSEASPVTGTTNTQYSKLTTIVTNAKGQKTWDIKNARGLTIETIDAAATSDAAHTYYDYDPAGNLLSVTDSAGNQTENLYNVRGHKTQTTDPDMGVWKYQYDVLGQLKRQTDAKGQVACFWYDTLGRMTQRIEFAGAALACASPPTAQEKATWVYDTAVKGIGKLAKETGSGFERTYTYDAKSRPASTTSKLDGVSYSTSQTYDINSRVSVITYPTGFAVRHVYKSSGYLEKVQHASTGQAYWTANSADAEGHITNETLGNELVTVRAYGDQRGRLESIKTGPTGGIQRLEYDFDPLGNLTERRDVRQSLAEGFGYDALNRLTDVTTVTPSGTFTKSIGYDELGNIETKSDLEGSYRYDSPRPHAMTTADGNTFGYDANGNMVSGADRTLTWSFANLPTKITKATVARYFHYGPDRARFKQVLTGSGATETTRYVGGLYELITKRQYHLPKASCLCQWTGHRRLHHPERPEHHRGHDAVPAPGSFRVGRYHHQCHRTSRRTPELRRLGPA